MQKRAERTEQWRQLWLTVWTLALVSDVYGDLTDGVGIQVGKFSGEDAENVAVAKLSQGQDQQSWWGLSNAAWHDSALDRFFASGPPNAEQLSMLAGSPTGSLSGISDADAGPDWDGMPPSAVLQNLASITYSKSKIAQGVGRIDASVQTIFFRCSPDDATCSLGHVVPVVITGANGTNQNTSAGSSADSNISLSYASLWLPIFPAMLYNAIPATINGGPRISLLLPSEDQVSITVHLNEQVPACNATAYEFYRSHLDSAYGLLPGLACLNLSTADGQISTMVLAALPGVPASLTTVAYTPAYTIEELLNVVLGESIDNTSVESLPLGECSQEPLLISDSSQLSQEMVTVCGRNVCVYAEISDWQNLTCDINEQQQQLLPLYGLNFLQSLSTLSASCNVSDELLSSGNMTNSAVSCTMPPTASGNGSQVTCTMLGVNISLISAGNSGVVAAPKSEWASSKGSNTSDFGNTLSDISMAQACSSSIDPLLLPGSINSAFLNVIHIRAISLLQRFVQAHSTSFDMKYGPASSLLNTLSVLISTVISVLLACERSIHSMRAFLKSICKKWPSLLQPASSKVSRRQTLMAFCFAILNSILTAAVFFPATYSTSNDYNRQSPYQTWDMGCGVMSFDPALQLRVIYFLEGRSKYVSHIAAVRMVAAVIVIFYVAYRTFTSLRRFFIRQAKNRRPKPSADDGSSTQSNNSAVTPKQSRKRNSKLKTSAAVDKTAGNGPQSLTNNDVELSASIDGRPLSFLDRGFPSPAERRLHDDIIPHTSLNSTPPGLFGRTVSLEVTDTDALLKGNARST